MFHSCYYLSLKATGTVYFTFMAFPFSVPGFHLGSIFIRRSASLSNTPYYVRFYYVTVFVYDELNNNFSLYSFCLGFGWILHIVYDEL